MKFQVTCIKPPSSCSYSQFTKGQIYQVLEISFRQETQEHYLLLISNDKTLLTARAEYFAIISPLEKVL